MVLISLRPEMPNHIEPWIEERQKNKIAKSNKITGTQASRGGVGNRMALQKLLSALKQITGRLERR